MTRHTVGHAFVSFVSAIILVVTLAIGSGAKGMSTAPPDVPRWPESVCDKFAAESGSDLGNGTWRRPFRSAQLLLNALARGQVGCLRAGQYTSGKAFVLEFKRSGVALVGYPGERAVVRGIVVVRQGVDRARLADVVVEGTGGSNTIQVYGTDFVLEDSDITNAWRGRSCLMLGDGSAGTAVRPVIRRNRFHECGSLANGNKDHAIYAAHVTDGRISENQFWNTAAYSVHLYPDAQRTVVSHNTIDGGSPSVRGGIVFGGDGNEASRDNIVEYNVIAYAATYNIESSWGAAIGTGNIARSNCVWGGGKGDIEIEGLSASGNILADPYFVDRERRDLRVGSASACRSAVAFPSMPRAQSPG